MMSLPKSWLLLSTAAQAAEEVAQPHREANVRSAAAQAAEEINTLLPNGLG